MYLFTVDLMWSSLHKTAGATTVWQVHGKDLCFKLFNELFVNFIHQTVNKTSSKLTAAHHIRFKSIMIIAAIECIE